MIGLGECAPCKAKRLQEESEREFRERYGMIDLNRRPSLPRSMGWKPFLGQAPPMAMAPAIPPSSTPGTVSPTYLENVRDRLLQFGAGTGVGFPLSLLASLVFKPLRRDPKEATHFIAMTTGIALLAALLPVKDNFLPVTVSRLMGVLAGSGLADIVLPGKKGRASWST